MWTAGDSAQSRKLLLATGVVDELPDIPGLGECYGISVHHCPYCDGWEHRHEPLLVLGTSAEDAVGLALSLQTWSREVTLLANGKALDEQDRQRLDRQGIAWRQERVVRLLHTAGCLEAALLAGGRQVPGRALFFSGKQRQSSDLPRQLGCWFDDQHADSGKRQRSSVPGIFLAGDVDGDVQFAVVAAAEGTTAAVALNKELQEEDRALFERRAPQDKPSHANYGRV